MIPLTTEQRALLLFIAKYSKEACHPPCMREMCESLDVALNALSRLLSRLKSRGMLDYEFRAARTVHLTARGYAAIGLQAPLEYYLYESKTKIWTRL